ncbi:MAG: thioredoxin [Pirellulales bacterium]|nr:thioredoxin [Pirellulales bacterium]
MSDVATFTDENFDAEVLGADQPVLVDFWAPWCGPCRQIAPLVDEIAKEQADIKVGKMNIDESPKSSQNYGVTAIPTLMIFKGGEVVEKFTGIQSKQRLEQALQAAR